MATQNPFDLLGDDDNDDPSQLIATVQQQKVAAAASATAGGKKGPAAGVPAKPAKLPSKPAPPTQAVRELRNEGGRGGGRGAVRGGGRGRGGYYRDRESGSNENTFNNDSGFSGGDVDSGRTSERRPYSGPRGGFRGGRRGGFSNEDGGEERPRRAYDRRSGTGRGNDFKREGAGRGNWGTTADEIAPVTEEPIGENETNAAAVEKKPNEEEKVDAEKENAANETEEKEPEEQQMTLEEYEKVLEEKRKALLPSKTEERKVDVKEFESMQLISKKKDEEEVFIKLGSEKDRRREAAEKEERAKKVSINEFLKPAEGEGYYRSGGRGRGRGRGSRGGYGGNNPYSMVIPKIEDPGQFPSLGAK